MVLIEDLDAAGPAKGSARIVHGVQVEATAHAHGGDVHDDNVAAHDCEVSAAVPTEPVVVTCPRIRCTDSEVLTSFRTP